MLIISQHKILYSVWYLFLIILKEIKFNLEYIPHYLQENKYNNYLLKTKYATCMLLIKLILI